MRHALLRLAFKSMRAKFSACKSLIISDAECQSLVALSIEEVRLSSRMFTARIIAFSGICINAVCTFMTTLRVDQEDLIKEDY